MTTARSQRIANCHTCRLATEVPKLAPKEVAHCPRCNSRLHIRESDSTSRTWALLLAAYFMYVPANLLPVSTIIYFDDGQPDTIMSSVIKLFQGGDAPIALVLFIASIAVPAGKMITLTWLLITVKLRSKWNPRDRTTIYRSIEFIGRWSMLDVFVISILVALVQLQAIATVYAGPGAIAFCAVVVLTMFAAESFDPRLMWDALEEES